MLFNSLSFAVFFPIVFILYWFVANKKLVQQNMMLLCASYYFYACWDYRFLFLLMFSTLLDYYTGIKMFEAKKNYQLSALSFEPSRHNSNLIINKLKLTTRFWFWLSIIINLGFLGVFKYYNFFAASFVDAASFWGLKINPWTIKVILPIGISFYTFHGLSYVIDIYKSRIEPCRNFVNYALFVSFFPLLVAGPIERATHLLPQIQKSRHFNYLKAVDGLKQILWGLFKKMVIADNCAQFANTIFNHSNAYGGSTLVAGAIFFAFQIYCDFSGYSDIALGTARLLGIELLQNFAFPYFSRDIAEFWRRWHISLSSWFRDYLYFPLGGSKGGMWLKIRNTFIIFLVSGFWHGANWTFIVWGALNAIYFLPLLIRNKNRVHLDIVAKGKLLPTFTDFLKILSTFGLTVFAWIFFRADNLSHAFKIISTIFSRSLFSIPQILPIPIILLIIIFIIIEWLGREQKYAIANIGIKLPTFFRLAIYYSLVGAILFFGGEEQKFIYFQF